MKKAWVWILVIAIIVVIGYLGRNKIGALYSGSYGSASLPNYMTTSPTTAPMVTGNIITTKSGSKGSYLVGANGMTLYVFDNDTKGVSTCYGSCAGIWPAYVTSVAPKSMPTGITTFTRTDGSIQFAYKGRPIYYYSGDSQIGDMNGDGIQGIWHIAKP